MREIFFILVLACFLHSAIAQDSGNQSVDLEFDPPSAGDDLQIVKKEADLLEALQKSPQSVSLQLELVRLYQAQRYYAKAVDLLEAILKRSPENEEAHFRLGQILGSQKREPERALEELQKAVAYQPDRLEYREELVNVLYRIQRYSQALIQLDEILQRDPSNANARYRKAVILYSQGKIAEAEALADNLPNHEHARVLKAVILQQRGEDAQSMFEALIRDCPQNLRARYEYGKMLFQKNEVAAAGEVFEKIIDEDPFYQHAVFYLVRIYSKSGERTKAQLAKQSLDTINRMGREQRNFYRSYLRHHPDTAETHEALGLIYLEIGRGNLAVKEFQEVMKLEPRHQEAPFYLAQIFMASGEHHKALPALEKCLEVREDKAQIHALMAQCHLKLKDAKNAAHHLQAALQINPQEPLANRLRDQWMKQNAQSKKAKAGSE